jgi:hypothetical protein
MVVLEAAKARIEELRQEGDKERLERLALRARKRRQR